MPERKLSYKVDVDTGTAVRDLEKLGTAGADAGKDIARGFDTAKSARAAALDALSAKMDQAETDAKGLATAVAAIKSHLTVDVDDSKVAGFASDLKNRMGVAFDDVTADAKEFAAVLERGVDLSKTTGEIRNVGTELDHTRGEADQSRSVLANMVGNTAQDLGNLGGVVGTLGVGIGQLAEYATDGNISLQSLAGMAGPLAGLAGFQIVLQGITSGLANLKKQQEAFTQQQEDFNTALHETGDLQQTVNDMLEKNTCSAASPELNWWQGMLNDLPVLGGMVDETTTHTSGLVEAMAAAGITADEWAFALDHGLGPFTALNQAMSDALATNQITQEQYDLLTKQLGLYSNAALLAEVNQQQLNTVFGDGTTALGAYQKAFTPQPIKEVDDATAGLIKSNQGLLQSADDVAAAVQADIDHRQEQVDAIQAVIDKNNDMIDASHTWADSQQDFRDATADLDDVMADTNATMANTVPGLQDYTDAQRKQRDTAEDWVDQLVATRIEFDKGRGVVRNAAQTQDDYAEGLGRIAGHLNADVIPAVADYYANLLQIPDDKITDFQMVLATGDQEQIATFVAQNSGTKTLSMVVVADEAVMAKTDRQIQSVGDGAAAAVLVSADTAPADAAVAAWVKKTANNPVKIPATVVVTRTVGVSGGYVKTSGRAAEPAGVGVSTLAAPAAATTTVGGPAFVVSAPAAPTYNVTLNAGVVGNRYDLQRWVRGALRDQQRLGRVPGAGDATPGPAGPAGADSTVPGPQGPAGPAGATGPQGTPGTPATYSDPAT